MVSAIITAQIVAISIVQAHFFRKGENVITKPFWYVYRSVTLLTKLTGEPVSISRWIHVSVVHRLH